jgi:lipopolysaccharide biosynthesis glycosyltransferase
LLKKKEKYHPNVSVVMVVYNHAEMLKDSIESILNQTYSDFEFIIFDNASTDNSAQIVKNYAAHDPRIVFIQNNENANLAYNSNRGIEIARGKYIAIMDDDAISALERFKKQVDFLDKNKDIAVVGTFIETFGDVNISTWITQSEPQFVALEALFLNPICNSATMIRKSFLKSNGITYNHKSLYAQDYELWKDIILKGGRIFNIPEILLKYRLHSKNITNDIEKQVIQDKVVFKIRKELWGTFFSRKEGAKLARELFGQSWYLSRDKRSLFINTLLKVAKTNNELFKSESVKQYIEKFGIIPSHMHIFFAADNNFAQHLCVAMASVIINKLSCDTISFYILDGGISDENKQKINKLSGSFVSIEYIKIRDESLKETPPPPPGYCCHITKQTYYRYLISELKPQLAKAFYLDCDIVVCNSLDILWNTDLGDNYVAAVEELHEDAEPFTFNAGILLINNKKWVEDNITKRLFENTKYLVQINKLKLLDQDVLNYTFKNSILWIDPMYNCQQNVFFDGHYDGINSNIYTSEQMRQMEHMPVIVHYNGNVVKPWIRCDYCQHHNDYRRLYFQYLQKSPFRLRFRILLKIRAKILVTGFVTRFLKYLFSIQNEGTHKVIRLFGVKIKIELTRLVLRQRQRLANRQKTIKKSNAYEVR